MFERFSKQARGVVVQAVDNAQARGSRRVTCEDLLVGLAAGGEPTLAAHSITADGLIAALGKPDNDDAQALAAIGVDLDEVKAQATANFGPDAWAAADPNRRRSVGGIAARLLGEHRPFTPAAKKSLELALREAIVQGSNQITTTHLLRGLLRSPGDGVGSLIEADVRTALLEESRRSA